MRYASRLLAFPPCLLLLASAAIGNRAGDPPPYAAAAKTQVQEKAPTRSTPEFRSLSSRTTHILVVSPTRSDAGGDIVRLRAVRLSPGAVQEKPANRRNPRSVSSRSSPARGRPLPGQLLWPVRGDVTSEFGRRWGRMHYGVDIAAQSGSRVAAAAGGAVTYAGWKGGYGLLVVIDHGGGLETWYGHNSEVLVGAGSRVAAGQPVSMIGSTGRSTGPHLHFEVRAGGRPQNPRRFLP